MKLSEDTVNVLKNFSGINQSIQFRSGNVLRTISPLKTVYAEATIGDNLPKECSIYDLNKLLAKISLQKDAELQFDDDKIVITSQSKKRSDSVKYCSPKTIVAPPEKSLTLDDPDYTFVLSQEDLDWMRRSAGISGSPIFKFESDGSSVNFIALDPKNDASDVSRIEIAQGDGKSVYSVAMKVENFKMMEGSYDVAIAKKGLVQFKHREKSVTYYVAIEAKDSTFGGGEE